VGSNTFDRPGGIFILIGRTISGANKRVIAYNDMFKAEEIRLKLWKMQKDYLMDLEDAVVAVKDDTGKVKLHQPISLTAAGSVSGFCGMMIGLMWGAATDELTDKGFDDKFVKDLAANMTPGSSMLFVLLRKATPEGVLEQLRGSGGKVLKTSLSHNDEAKVQRVLSSARKWAA
jgi:uncharacterized membrane protein